MISFNVPPFVGVERLKVRDYDAIIICNDTQHVRAEYDKILQIVPDMADRIVYNFQWLPV